MELKRIINKLQILKIKGILKLNQYLHPKLLTSGKDSPQYSSLKSVGKHLNTEKICIQLDKKDEVNKTLILDIIELLGKYSIEVELIEFEQIFNNKDMKKILERNPNAKIHLAYILKSYFTGSNTELSYDIDTYCEILDKIEYLTKVTKANFKEDDERVMFIITQLADYISFDRNYELANEEKLKEISSLKGALLNRKSVCIGYAMAFERCMADLGIDCIILSGRASNNQPRNLNFFDDNHAWNQVKLKNKWYNVDVTWLSTDESMAEEEKLKCILVDDKNFENHYMTGSYKKFRCDKSYDNRKELYQKVKKVKNVLKMYDLGKRDTILQYDLTDNPLKDREKEEKEKEHTKSNENRIKHSERFE